MDACSRYLVEVNCAAIRLRLSPDFRHPELFESDKQVPVHSGIL